MNKRFNKIIREEINRLILSEALDVSPLSKYIQPLKKYVSNIKNIGYSRNKEIDAFLDDICVYILQIVFGINRCVQANSLNEDFRLSDYGVQYPAELGGNLWNEFENGLYKGGNWMRNQLYKRGYMNNGNAANYNNGNANIDVNNPNSVPTVKLQDSLRNLMQIALRWKDLQTKYQNETSKYFDPINDSLIQISDLDREYKAIQRNAQGTNP